MIQDLFCSIFVIFCCFSHWNWIVFTIRIRSALKAESELSAVYTFPVSPVFQFSSSKNWKGGVFQFSCSHFSSFPVFQFQFWDVTFPVFAAGVRTGKRENWKTGSGFPVFANRIISISKPENIQGFLVGSRYFPVPIRAKTVCCAFLASSVL